MPSSKPAGQGRATRPPRSARPWCFGKVKCAPQLAVQGGACTCQRRMCTVWFNPGNSAGARPRGAARGSAGGLFQTEREGADLPRFCVRDCGGRLPRHGQAGAGGRRPPPRPQLPRRLGDGTQALSAGTAAHCPLQARALGGQVRSREGGLVAPASEGPQRGQDQGPGPAAEPAGRPAWPLGSQEMPVLVPAAVKSCFR